MTTAENLLTLADNSRLIYSIDEYEDYLVKLNNKYCVYGITYEYNGDPEPNFQTAWEDTAELAIQKYQEEYEIATEDINYSEIGNI